MSGENTYGSTAARYAADRISLAEKQSPFPDEKKKVALIVKLVKEASTKILWKFSEEIAALAGTVSIEHSLSILEAVSRRDPALIQELGERFVSCGNRVAHIHKVTLLARLFKPSRVALLAKTAEKIVRNHGE